MVSTAIGFLAGVCAVLTLDAWPSGGAVSGVLVLAALAAIAVRHWAPLAFALGLCWCWLDGSQRLHDRLDPALEGRDLAMRGVVASVPQRRADGVRFRIESSGAPGVPRVVELTWYEPAFVPVAAQRLELVARMRRPRGFANPGGMDQEARLFREGIGATGYVKSAADLGRHATDVWSRPVLAARSAIDAAIRRSLGERPATGIVAGLAVGLQDALSREQWRQLARSGTSHLMAISGMHIGMFAAVAAWIAARVQRFRQRRGALGAQRDVAVTAGTTCAFAYSLLAGWSVPTQRTMIMIALVALALRLRRRVGLADALAVGIIAVLLLDPLAPLAPGFWLSFGAVAAIVLSSSGHLARPSLVVGFSQAQIGVTVGLVPVLIGSFGTVSLVSPAVNVLAIPLYTLVIVPGVLVASASALLVPAAGAQALAAVAWLVESTWPLISVPAAWSLATLGVASLPAWAWIVLAICAAAALLPLPVAGRVAAAGIAAALCAWRPAVLPEGAARFTLLDVGQGLASVVETRSHVLVYDSGPEFRSGTDTGMLVVEPYLRSLGLRRIDLLVASHDDADHAGGARSLVELSRVGQLAASGRALDPLGHVTRCVAGSRWAWDGVEFEWMHPGAALLPRDNDRSCVLRIRAGEHTLLLTGDIEKSAERELLDRAPPGRAEVVVVPHHGSRSSSSGEFVAATSPRLALVSSGYRNRWGFPARTVRERWRNAGAEVLDTATSGAIELELRPGSPLTAPVEWRKSRRRAWQDP